MSLRVAFHTLGCRLNQAETAALQQAFEQVGCDVVPFGDACDVVVVNTCTVTANGDSDARRLVNRIHRRQSDARVALIGCQAQLHADELSTWPGVRWVVGTADKMQLPKIVLDDTNDGEIEIHLSDIGSESFRMPVPALDKFHTRANLKIQDGCNFFCTYCEIPYARGRARSREYDDLLNEARALIDAGFPEIILTGINVGCYSHGDRGFLSVVRGLLGLDGLGRLRISSIEPTTVGSELIRLMANESKLCRHIHLPLQSGCDGVLKRMNRRYGVAEYAEFVNEAHAAIPGLCLGADVMVGFPGESAVEFRETKDFLKGVPLSYLHVFSYSSRPNARAGKLGLDEVPVPEKKRRSEALRAIGDDMRDRFLRGMLGQTVSVLAEQSKDGWWNGLTDTFVRVRFRSDSVSSGEFVSVRLVEVDGASVRGKVC